MEKRGSDVKREQEKNATALPEIDIGRQNSLEKLNDFYNNPDPKRLQYIAEIMEDDNFEKRYKIDRSQYAGELINKIDSLLSVDTIPSGDNVKRLKGYFNKYIFGEEFREVNENIDDDFEHDVDYYNQIKRYWSGTSDVMDINPRNMERLYNKFLEEGRKNLNSGDPFGIRPLEGIEIPR